MIEHERRGLWTLMTDDDKKCCEIEDDKHSQVVKEEVVESCIIDDPDMEIQVKTLNMESPPKVHQWPTK